MFIQLEFEIGKTTFLLHQTFSLLYYINEFSIHKKVMRRVMLKYVHIFAKISCFLWIGLHVCKDKTNIEKWTDAKLKSFSLFNYFTFIVTLLSDKCSQISLCYASYSNIFCCTLYIQPITYSIDFSSRFIACAMWH